MTDDLEARMELSRRAIEQVESERSKLERVLLRLPSITAELDPDRLAAGLTEVARELTGARFGLFLPAGSERGTLTFVGLTRAEFAEPPAVGRAPVLAGVLLGQGCLRIDDVTAWAPSEEAARAYGVLADGRLVRSWLAAPVRGRRGTPLGVVYLGHHRAHAFTARHEELVDGLCHQLGVALEHAALFAERTQVASALAESLLPPLLPDIPGMTAAARYRPSGAGNLVGGDFYDLFETTPGVRGAPGEDGVRGTPRENGVWGLLLGDVSGFGPEAAALTGVARYTVRAVAADSERPSEVLRRLNEAVMRQGSERFLTAVYASVTPAVSTGTPRTPGGAIEPGTIHVVLASGGHPPAVVLRDDESVEVLDRSTGTLLGVFPDIELCDQELTLRAGDALILVTDGVLEARDDSGVEFGLERLEALASTCAGRSAEGIARRIERAVLDHRGERADDDVAIVVLRAEPT